jgi:hypothetical protein
VFLTEPLLGMRIVLGRSADGEVGDWAWFPPNQDAAAESFSLDRDWPGDNGTNVLRVNGGVGRKGERAGGAIPETVMGLGASIGGGFGGAFLGEEVVCLRAERGGDGLP